MQCLCRSTLSGQEAHIACSAVTAQLAGLPVVPLLHSLLSSL
jgi:hypothetical protein